ncbi:MAG TPA: DUF177 domain-containing protein [Coriobacteriia bacterium]
MNSYRVDVQSILEVLAETIEVSDDLPLDTFEVGTEVFKPQGPAHFDVTLTNTGTAIVGMGKVRLPVLATCARCLAEFPVVIEGEVDGFYIRPGQEEGLPDEQQIEYIDFDHHVDILPAVMAALILEAPFAPLHDENCAGICATCGADLNEGPCGCQEPADDSHPFAALRDLLGKPESHGE